MTVSPEWQAWMERRIAQVVPPICAALMTTTWGEVSS